VLAEKYFDSSKHIFSSGRTDFVEGKSIDFANSAKNFIITPGGLRLNECTEENSRKALIREIFI
jgi:hypothetical protein